MEQRSGSVSSISSHSSDNNSHVSFEGGTSTPISSKMDKGYYRQVLYRFFTNESNTDACKLEKLTNLFPDMKATIELELFKINNLSRTIDRLSRIYTVLTAMDIRDDTLHLFLGPYHLSLGPALFAALHFKNASAALLIASHTSSTGNSEVQRRKRRREAVLRRFRRAVRKLTLVKSIIDQLRPASVLTPYNQYELYSHGIYDLVLAGRVQDADSMFTNIDFLEQLENFDTTTNAGEQSPLLASNYIKINNLLNLLSSSQQSSQPSENNTMTTNEKVMRIKSNESIPNTTMNHETGTFLDSSTGCCSYHRQTLPYIMFPVNQTMSPQPSQSLFSKSRSRNNSNPNLLKTSSVLSRQSTVNSLPDSTAGDGSNSDLPSSASVFISSQPTPANIELETPTNTNVQHPFFSSDLSSSPSTTNEEDALINSISSLLASHLLSRQSTVTIPITSHTVHEQHETNSNLSDSAISLSTTGTTGPINSVVISNQSSPTIVTNDFDKLLQRIKTAVDNRLSIETSSNQRMRPPQNVHHNFSHNPIRSATLNRRQKLLALHAVSCQETHTDDYDDEHSTSANNKHKLDLLSKSQSFDASNLIISSSNSTSDYKPGRTSTIH